MKNPSLIEKIAVPAIIFLLLLNVSLFLVYMKIKSGPSTRPTSSRVPAKQFNSKATQNLTGNLSWPTYKNPKYSYSMQYPPEFTVEAKGKVQSIEDMTSFYVIDSGRRYAVASVQILPQRPKNAKAMVQEKGVDGDGNEVITYYFPYQSDKSLILQGTIQQNVFDKYRFETILNQIASTVKI